MWDSIEIHCKHIPRCEIKLNPKLQVQMFNQRFFYPMTQQKTCKISFTALLYQITLQSHNVVLHENIHSFKIQKP